MLGLEIILGGVLLIWCGLGLYSLWSTRGVEVLRPRAVSLPQSPKVSIILSARDEEETLPAALESLLELDYPVYEVILVDDDLTDRTGLIADEWAAVNSSWKSVVGGGVSWKGRRYKPGSAGE
ncbi:MAG: hypothetical protein DMG23_07425 [Acidobacteria bacterium]|nr:MAG: hypothetical protein DMG23_07425 [Acidobacteriota bacterium]